MKVWMRKWGDDYSIAVSESDIPAGDARWWWQQELDDDLVAEFRKAQDRYYSLVQRVDEAARPGGETT